MIILNEILFTYFIFIQIELNFLIENRKER